MISEQVSKHLFDVCIIGSGPAGIICALEYARKNPNHQVLLIEYGIKGQASKNSLDDRIEIKNSLNHHDPYEATNKGLGGTSATWGGRCVMYDEVDFIDRTILNEGCTWHIDLLNEINQYLPQTADYFECGKPIFNLKEVPQLGEKHIAENFVDGIVTDSIVERWSMPTRFGERYAKDIADQPNLTFIEGFEARDFSSPDNLGNVSTLSIRDIKTKKIEKIKAHTFILAAGAQESTRILLRNPQLFKKLSDIPSSLGKYYQGHVSGKIASVQFKGDPKKTEYGFLRDTDGSYFRRRFQFSSEFLINNNLLNTAIWLDNPLYFDPKHRSGAMSFMYLAMITPIIGKKLAPPAISHSITKGKVTGIPQHFWNIFRKLPGSLVIPASIFVKRYLFKRKLPGVFLFSPQNRYALHFHAEQVPDAENRMELGQDKETLVIHYKLTDEDINSVIKLHHTLDEWLRSSGCGELNYWYDKEELPNAIRGMSKDGIHQVGTTRLADSPEKGVVDQNLNVWGTSNIFVCSSSVFPTSGQANPTFLLGAFAVRLAHYLTRKNENN
ncbi:GMC family oxidoreductase [Spirosoma sp. KCTC 42546]|uniref:GMC oxidoreductase n=1 Tax=Spirosoma sp. KCTC 42546 TaxID=2520506 RepID=UPI00115BC340|nr:GMC oxidoreductase [Spirosoma sp. KCTC 42546]QDK78667.1 GMC family oxidoreductase [Spirosoma sp. KCTC 42546]